jgi:hypothetical protein
LANPYQFLNWSSYTGESGRVLRDWFSLSFDPVFIGLFVWNSLVPGFGLALVFGGGAILLWRVLRPAAAHDRAFGVGVLAIVGAVGLITASLSGWHINARYVPYLLSVLLIFLATTRLKHRDRVLAAILVVSALQSVPMLMAYRDENDDLRSTRMQAARWIDANVPEGTPIGLGTLTLSPYEVPPFKFARYRINPPEPVYYVMAEPESEQPRQPKGTVLVVRFAPRMPRWGFPFVYGFINPQFSVYRVVTAGQTK